MQFNSHSEKDDIISDITFRTGASLAEYTINDRTRNSNLGYHELISEIQKADAKWQFDDSNNTTLPIATTDLIANQRDYGLSDDMIFIERVEVKGSDGFWRKLDTIDISDISCALDEYQKASGSPNEYDKSARSLNLYPASSVTVPGGLRTYFKRSANIFVTSDTTKSPGFDITWHAYIPLYASLQYCRIYKKDRVQGILDEMAKIISSVKTHYATRSKEDVSRMTPAPINFR